MAKESYDIATRNSGEDGQVSSGATHTGLHTEKSKYNDTCQPPRYGSLEIPPNRPNGQTQLSPTSGCSAGPVVSRINGESFFGPGALSHRRGHWIDLIWTEVGRSKVGSLQLPLTSRCSSLHADRLESPVRQMPTELHRWKLGCYIGCCSGTDPRAVVQMWTQCLQFAETGACDEELPGIAMVSVGPLADFETVENVANLSARVQRQVTRRGQAVRLACTVPLLLLAAIRGTGGTRVCVMVSDSDSDHDLFNKTVDFSPGYQFRISAPIETEKVHRPGQLKVRWDALFETG